MSVHVIIYGETNSGKTTCCKFIVNALRPKKIFVFTRTPEEYTRVYGYTPRVYTDGFTENIKTTMEECRRDLPTDGANNKYPYIVILDDFNNAINTNTDPDYRELFTRGRHMGIQVINLAHNSRAIGTTARNNAGSIIIMACTSTSELEELARIFYDGKTKQLQRIAREAKERSPFAYLVLNKRTGVINIGVVEPHQREPRGKTIEPVHADTTLAKRTPTDVLTDNAPRGVIYDNTHNNFNIDTHIDIPLRSSLAQCLPVFCDGVAPPIIDRLPAPITTPSGMPIGTTPITTNICSKTANQMVDNSTNNIVYTHNMKLNQMHETNITANEIKMANLIHQRQSDDLLIVFKTKELIYKSFKSHQEKEAILSSINYLLHPPRRYSIIEYNTAVNAFLRRYYNEEYHEHKPSQVLDALGVLAMTLGNKSAPLGTAFVETMSQGYAVYEALSK